MDKLWMKKLFQSQLLGCNVRIEKLNPPFFIRRKNFLPKIVITNNERIYSYDVGCHVFMCLQLDPCGVRLDDPHST